YYTQAVLIFADKSHPDITVVVNQNDARRIQEGDTEFIENIKRQWREATQGNPYEKGDDISDTMESQSFEEESSSDKQDAVKWNTESVKLLISLKKENTEMFSSNIITQKQGWKKISEMMCLKGHHCTGEECDKKFRSLKMRYKLIKERHKRTGSGRQSWQFFPLMDDLLQGDPAVIPTTVASSVQIQNSPTLILPPKKKKKIDNESAWVTEYRKQLKTMHEERMELEKEKLKLEERRVAALEKLINKE
ncbi:uncharacterized protein LOC134250052, partial [Saccostrea cucullata]|uniref:uncharacterized protein LOC134250052 n=1 Tax=Saccostrea cuccullata TaxID=36930 RepID=UPI002ED4FDE4